jgi:hypothetical protein
MAGLKGKSGPPGNMNAFKHGLPRDKVHFPLVVWLWQSSGKAEKFYCVFSRLEVLRGLVVLVSSVSNARGMHRSAGNVPC